MNKDILDKELHQALRELVETIEKHRLKFEREDYFIRRTLLTIIMGAIFGYISTNVDPSFGVWFWVTIISLCILYAVGVLIHDIGTGRFEELAFYKRDPEERN